eukprot:gb/GEZJ01003104.1/.p1 GENE.gb/GEZJ01003104.1/~~gb/GEZJ01003104.1/.p1  ORF type:complete len:149 (+),score=11.79 gb/GEZJ01003104.1/:3156-3602(+)
MTRFSLTLPLGSRLRQHIIVSPAHIAALFLIHLEDEVVKKCIFLCHVLSDPRCTLVNTDNLTTACYQSLESVLESFSRGAMKVRKRCARNLREEELQYCFVQRLCLSALRDVGMTCRNGFQSSGIVCIGEKKAFKLFFPGPQEEEALV